MGEALKDQKILCVCQEGAVRSVGTKIRLTRRRFYNSVAIGWRTASPELLEMLCTWADKILIAEPSMAKHLPGVAQSKIEHGFTIGEDIGWYAAQPELQEIIRGALNKVGLR